MNNYTHISQPFFLGRWGEGNNWDVPLGKSKRQDNYVRLSTGLLLTGMNKNSFSVLGVMP